MKNNKFTIKKCLAMFCVSILLTTSFSGCTKNTSQKEVASPKPTPEMFNKEEDKSSNLGLWTRAMGSVLIYINDGNPYYFGGYYHNEDNQKGAANILSSSWNINSREDLLKKINYLLKTGDRKEYLKEAKEMKAMPKKKLKTAMKQLSGDILIHYQTIQYNWKKWKKKGLLAWDMCRISHIIQWGYVAKYIDAKEAQALIEPAAKKLQKKFSTWEEVQHNWLDGYCLYANVDRKAAGNDYVNRKTIYEKIRDKQTKEYTLYDDSLFGKDIIPLSDISYKSILDEIKESSDKKENSNTKKDSKKKKTK